MSAEALKYVLNRQDLRGGPYLVMLMIAWRIPTGRNESRPTPLHRLAMMTRLDERSVRRHRQDLVKEGDLKIRGRGASQTYVMVNLTGVASSDPGKLSAAPQPKETGKLSVSDPGKLSAALPGTLADSSQESRAIFPNSSAPTRSLSGSTYVQKTTTTSNGDGASEIESEVSAFLRWWADEYPKHNNGAQWTVDPIDDASTAGQLLSNRSFERLQKMSLALWRSSDPWIRTTDRGLRVLKHKGNHLDLLVSETLKPTQTSPGLLIQSWVSQRCRKQPPCRALSEHRRRCGEDLVPEFSNTHPEVALSAQEKYAGLKLPGSNDVHPETTVVS